MHEDDFKYGFRHDPMTWVASDTSLAAARVRTEIFGTPHEGDQEILDSRINEILTGQAADGSFGDTSKITGTHLLELLELGAGHGRPETKRAVAALLRQARAGCNAREWYEESDEVLSIYALHALCRLGLKDEPEVLYSLAWFVHHPDEWNSPWRGCPWTPAVFWSALWAGREWVGVESTIADGMRRVAGQMNDAGCCAYNDPWGFTDAAGRVDTPEARALVARQIPLILRAQHPDGGFGGVSVQVFRALRTHGFLDQLRNLPPLPPDWREVRQIPLPDGTWFSLTWDGEDFWSYDHKSKKATALSSVDGRVTRRVAIENCHAIGWWNGTLAAVGSDPKVLKQVDPVTGAVLKRIPLDHMEQIIDPEHVEGKILVGDRFLGCVSIIDPTGHHEPHMQCLAGPFPACLAADGEHVWHADRYAPAIIKSDLQGRLLDWGGKPFGIQGMTFDNRYLWALDGEARRICAIERVYT